MVLLLLVPVLLQKPLLNSDGDLARHLRHGRHMLEQGGLIRADPFSFTRPGAPFLGFEYGSQVIYALAERVGGLPAVAVLAGLLVALTYALLTGFLLKRGVDPLLTSLTVGLSIVLGVEHWTARPHLFSFLAVVILLGLLERKSPGRVVGYAALFTVWANIHGGFVYGWILISLYLIGSLGEMVWSPARDTWRERSGYYLRLLLTTMAVTLVNPRGLELHRHLWEFFSTPFLRNNTVEFTSPNFHEAGSQVFLAILLLTLVILTLYRQRPTLPRLLVICAGAAFALIAIRNIPLYGLTVLPLLALHVDDGWRRLSALRGIRGRFEATAGRTSTLPWTLALALLLGGLALSHGRIGSLQLIGQNFDPTVFPVDAVARARSAGLDGHLFSELIWGGYVLYGWPEQRVFIDGGTDFYGEALFREYIQIVSLASGWRHLLEKWDISLALLPPRSALAHELAREPGWALWHCDSVAALLTRGKAGLPLVPRTTDSAEQQLENCAE
jgi:fermentation-respiration switch protein FrsA (DUF1100 family)